MGNVIYISKLAAASFLNLTGLLPKTVHPQLVNIKLVENCNARCITCDYWRTYDRSLIETERAKSLFKELHILDIKNLRLTGGEPLLRKDLFEVLGACGNNWFKKVILATNGLLLSHFADKINESIITQVTVSLDAVGERNDRIRGIKGYYDKVINSLHLIKKHIKIVSTFTKDLISDLEELIFYCNEHGYDYDVNLLDKQMYFFSSKDVRNSVKSLWPSEENTTRGLKLLSDYKILPNYILENIRMFLADRSFEFDHCIQGFIEVNIDAKGQVRTGCNVFKPVGNIIKDDLITIINSTAYHNSVKQMYGLDCPLCTCGYGISASFKKPWCTFPYVLKRIR